VLLELAASFFIIQQHPSELQVRADVLGIIITFYLYYFVPQFWGLLDITVRNECFLGSSFGN